MNELHVLARPVMTANEAAVQLGMPTQTLRTWLEGRSAKGKFYEPILRPEPLGHYEMTWGEVVEAKYLRAYRNHVSLQQLRPFVAALRENFGVPYPLAHFRPFVDTQRQLLLNLQEQTGLPDELWVVFHGNHGQLLLNPLVEREFLQRVEFATTGQREAERLRPMGKSSPVVLDPLRASGAASVRGVRCDALAELVDAGELVEEVADDFGLTVPEVKSALAYVWQRAA